MNTKRLVAAALCLVMIFALCACGNTASTTPAASTDAAPAASTEAAPAEKTFNLTLAHNLAEDHAVNVAMVAWAEAVKTASNGSINIEIVANGVLGSENDCIGLIQADQLEMTKVSAGTLGNFDSTWNCLSVPYVFRDRDHLYTVMNSDIAADLYKLTESAGFVGLTWLESGIRCFYTKDVAVRTPADLKGLTIRSMTSDMAVAMMDQFGATAKAMGYGDIYTAMQTGQIDGAENNVTALRDHMEVTKYYCYDEHTMIPDIIVISAKVWNEMSEAQQEIMKSTALDMTANYRQLWADFEQSVIDMATEKGVEFITDVDKAAFVEAVKPIYEDLAANQPATYAFVERIQAA